MPLSYKVEWPHAGHDPRLSSNGNANGHANGHPGEEECLASFGGTVADWRRLGSVATGRFIRDIPIPGPIVEQLNSIHSQTTEGERRFLYNFMAHLWNGANSVLEVGPYLGGTTRCLGKGMLANARASADTRRFFSLDYFESYGSRDGFARETAQLVQAYAQDDKEILDEIAKRGWEKLFRRVHLGADYGPFLDIRKTKLPDRPGEPIVPALQQAATDAGPIEVLFIDGCKSWYGTKVCMATFVPALNAGGYVIFQDYGRYTCFWISAFIHSFADYFTLIAGTSGTYAFSYRGGLTAEEINSRFPDEPDAWSAADFEKLYLGVLKELAFTAGDAVAGVRLTLHLAAALATIGELEAARTMIDRLAGEPLAAPLLHEIREARVTPTWNWKGVVYL